MRSPPILPSDSRSTPPAPWNKGRSLPAEPLTESEVRGLLSECSSTAPTGIRNRALIVVLYRAGLRISEALDLFPKDLDLEAGTARILHGKGDRARTVGFDELTAGIVQRWLDRRLMLGFGKREPVFCTLRGQLIKTSYVRALFPRLARKAGIEKRVHAHGLRHSFAAELAKENVPINLIQRQLGHASVATTDRYLNSIAPQQVIDAMRMRRWGGEPK